MKNIFRLIVKTKNKNELKYKSIAVLNESILSETDKDIDFFDSNKFEYQDKMYIICDILPALLEKTICRIIYISAIINITGRPCDANIETSFELQLPEWL